MKKYLKQDSYFDLIKKTIPDFENYILKNKIVISDCDGILNDGKMHCTAEGKLFKSYGCHDKELIKFFISLGWKFIFVTNDQVGYKITKKRLEDSLNYGISPNIELYIVNSEERYNLIKGLVNENIVIFCGDSLSDIKSLSIATLSGTTNNAFPPVKEYCDYVSPFNGGEGGFADILFNLLKETY